MKNFNEALKNFNRAKRIDPNDHDVLVELANLHESNNNFIEALNCSNDAIQVFQQNKMTIHPEIYVNIGSFLHKKENFEEAKQSYDKALTIVKQTLQEPFTSNQALAKTKLLHCAVLYNIGCLYESQGKPHEAEGYFKNIVTENELYIGKTISKSNFRWP